MIIERASPADVSQLVLLLADLFEQEVELTPDADKQARGLNLILENPQIGILFVARDAGAVVGMISVLFTVSTAEGARACWLEDVVVRRDYRSRGVGSELLTHAVEHARSVGCRRVTLLTDRANEAGRRFYSRHGFDLSEMVAMRLPLPTA